MKQVKSTTFLWATTALSIFISCSVKRSGDESSGKDIERQLQIYSQRQFESEAKDDLQTFISFYHDSAISMPEYQTTLNGRSEIESFYREMFGRQTINKFRNESREFIHMGNTIVEIGTFNKEYTDSDTDSLQTLNGKYWHVWEAQQDGDYKLKGESYGYYHHVSNPWALVVSPDEQPGESDLTEKNIPFELKAYNALMEKGVRNRDALLRTEFFTDDGSFYPFADTIITGIENIKPYLIAYSSGT